MPYGYFLFLNNVIKKDAKSFLKEKEKKEMALKGVDLTFKSLLALLQSSYLKLDFAAYLAPEPWTNCC